MATGASGCDVAVILIDARQGVLTQTRRHTFIAALLGIRHVIVAVNKMDLVDFRRERLRRDPQRIHRVHRQSRHRRSAVHSDLGVARRQRRRKVRRDAVVPGQHPDAPVGERADRLGPQLRRLPFRGATREPARFDVPRLQRHGAERHRSARRSDRRAAVRQNRRRSRASSRWTAISTKHFRRSRSR